MDISAQIVYTYHCQEGTAPVNWRRPGRVKHQRQERDAQEKQDKALVLEALRAVLKDPEATTEQRIFAVCALDNMQYYHIVPYSVKHPGTDSDDLIAAFAKRLEAYQGKDK